MTLARLIDAVEAGTLCSGDFIKLDDCELIYSVFPLSEENFHAELVSLCMEGSLDAALSLKDSLLPTYWFQLSQWPVPEMALARVGGAEGRDKLPSRAFLLAILRAMEGRE